MKKRIIAMLLTVSLLLILGCTGVYAETTGQERVYVVADPDGSVLSLTDTVHLENADKLEELAILSMLDDLQNVSGEEAFIRDGQTVIWKAAGSDITYQGTSEKAPAVMPVVQLTLDGEEVSASDLSDKQGKATIEVSYLADGAAPALTITAIMLPEEGVTDIHTENAAVMTEAGCRMLVGWAIPGANEDLGLPVSFRADFQAEQPELSWMMTIVTSDPIHMLCTEVEERAETDAHLELDEAKSVLLAMQNGDPIPATTGKTNGLGHKINELNDGLKVLNNGATKLAEGAAELSDGTLELSDGTKELADGAQELLDGAVALADGAKDADSGAQQLASGADTLSQGISSAAEGSAQLTAGLETISANSDALNHGAQMIFSAILNTTNEQLDSSGLDAAGISLPELTAENYAAVLEQVMDQVNPETVKAMATSQAEPLVRQQIEAQKAQIQAAVEAQVKTVVLEGVLQAAQIGLTVEEYQLALQSGQIPAEQNAAIQAAVQEQLLSDEILTKTEKAVQAQIDNLVAENVEKVLASDLNATAQLTAAQTAYESMSALKEELDQVNAFVTGLAQYTEGVDQAAAGASELQNGMQQLEDGSVSLSAGASELSAGTESLADGATRLADGISALRDGTVLLVDGADKLYDGSVELADGASDLQKEGTQKLMNQILDAEKEAAEKLLPYLEDDLENALRIFEDTRDNTADAGYDLRTEGVDTTTAYIIRTDLK